MLAAGIAHCSEQIEELRREHVEMKRQQEQR
jgi:hypothetical protein